MQRKILQRVVLITMKAKKLTRLQSEVKLRWLFLCNVVTVLPLKHLKNG